MITQHVVSLNSSANVINLPSTEYDLVCYGNILFDIMQRIVYYKITYRYKYIEQKKTYCLETVKQNLLRLIKSKMSRDNTWVSTCI